MSIRVRFNLGRGLNYKKWKVEFSKGQVEYFEPSRVSLVMKNCRLKNRPGSAQRIFDGHQKFVCAWIECDSFELREPLSLTGEEVKYNPRVQPHWTLNEINIDDARFEELTTSGKTVFIT